MSRKFVVLSTHLVGLFPHPYRYFGTKMNKPPSFVPDSFAPTGVRGMKVLDREKFGCVVQVPILKVAPEEMSKTISLCKPFLLKLENFKPVQDLENEAFPKCIHLNPEKIKQWIDFPKNVREAFIKSELSEANFGTREVHLTYDNFKSDIIFKAVLPEGEDIVSGFSQIGHIIHLNLRDHLLDYRKLIGQVLVDKIKTCRTVVNKSNIIDNTYRNFSMEVIAGDDDFLVTVKENGCNFSFDFSKVYWNPRLCKEHERILKLLKPGDFLFDVFCGVGPFSIPAAKKKCKVYANDLNPECFKWLNHNAKNNKVNLSIFHSYNQDGKDFICNIFKDYIVNYCRGIAKLDEGATIRITMNLPAIAVEFLKNFNGLIKDEELIAKLDREILIYVYCFAVGDSPVQVAKQLVIDNIGCDISANILDVFDVRNVSPKKQMMRVTLQLTKEVLCGKSGGEIGNMEPPSKKLCVSDN